MKYIKKITFLLVVIVVTIFIVNHLNQNNYKREVINLRKIDLNGKEISILKETTGSENILIKDRNSEGVIYKLKEKDAIPEDYIDLFPFKGEKEDYVILITKWTTESSQVVNDEGYTISIINEDGKNLNENDSLIWFGKWLKENESIDLYVPYNKELTKNKIILELKKLSKEGKL